MQNNNIKALTEQFHKFEIKHIKSEDWEVWDSVRFNVYYQIQDTLFGGSFVTGKSDRKKRNYSKILNDIFNLILHCVRNRKKNLIFAASRFKDEKGRNYDPNIIDVYELIKNDCLILDSVDVKGKNRYITIPNRGIGIFKKYYEKCHKLSLPNYINEAIYEEFGIKIPDTLIKFSLTEYYSQKSFYSFLFRLLKPKKIFITQNGIQKGLFRAARDLKIDIIELQHGIIYFSHLAYSYPKSVNRTKLALPNYFFVYSKFWKDKIDAYFPVDNIVISGNTIANEVKYYPIRYDITFICTSAYTNIFLEIIKGLRESGYRNNICLKLHPQQFNEIESIKRELEDYSNVDVVFVEVSMKDIIGMSNSLLTIQSTSAYEVLDAGKRLFIWQAMSYENHSDIFTHPLVKLIDNTEKLLNCLNNPELCVDDTTPPMRFFEPFHKERIIKILEISDCKD